MIFALGVFSAGLVSLLSLPAFWRRALRLSRNRLEMQMPLSMDEIVAERDQLRAEFAAERRRIEQRLEAAGGQRAADMGELGRRAIRTSALESNLTDLTTAHQTLTAQFNDATRAMHEANGEAGALAIALHDETSVHDNTRDLLNALKRDHHALREQTQELNAAFAAADAKAQALNLYNTSLETDLGDRHNALRLAEERAATLATGLQTARAERDAQATRLANVQARNESEMERSARLQSALDDARAGAEKTLAAQREAARAIEAADRARANAEDRTATLMQRLEDAGSAARKSERDAADRIEALRSEIAALKGALDAARARPSAGDDEALRRAIAEIGAKVLQTSRSVDAPAAE